MARNRQLVWITPVHFDRHGRPVDPDYGLEEGAGPDQGLPGGEYPDQGLPGGGWGGRPPRPDQGLPGRPGRPVDPGWGVGGRPPRPGQGLPRPPIFHPGHPDHGLPSEGEIPGIPDQELPPGTPVAPGQLPTLPATPPALASKLIVAVHKPNTPPTEWVVTAFDIPAGGVEGTPPARPTPQPPIATPKA